MPRARPWSGDMVWGFTRVSRSPVERQDKGGPVPRGAEITLSEVVGNSPWQPQAGGHGVGSHPARVQGQTAKRAMSLFSL